MNKSKNKNDIKEENKFKFITMHHKEDHRNNTYNYKENKVKNFNNFIK